MISHVAVDALLLPCDPLEQQLSACSVDRLLFLQHSSFKPSYTLDNELKGLNVFIFACFLLPGF